MSLICLNSFISYLRVCNYSLNSPKNQLIKNWVKSGYRILMHAFMNNAIRYYYMFLKF